MNKISDNGKKVKAGIPDTEKIADNNKKIRSKNNAENVSSIFAFGGGKGGVGKTVIAASLGVGLAMLNRKVIVVDADLGGANLHKVMGIDKPKKTYYNFFNRECKKLEDVLIEHPHFGNLKIISGAGGALGIANLQFSQKMKFIRHLKQLDTDYVIIDLGAGHNYNVLDFFLAADHGVVVVNPDHLSILDGYNFIKQAFYRKITRMFRNTNGAYEIIKKYSVTNTHKGPSSVENLLKEIVKIDKDTGKKIEKFIGEFHPMLIANQIGESEDEVNGIAVKVAAKDLLSIDMDYIGAIRRDDTVRKSINAKVPFIDFDSKCHASRDLANIIITKILHTGKFDAIRARHTIRQNGKRAEEIEKTGVICSVYCPYWEECDYRNGGFPCVLGGL